MASKAARRLDLHPARSPRARARRPPRTRTRPPRANARTGPLQHARTPRAPPCAARAPRLLALSPPEASKASGRGSSPMLRASNGVRSPRRRPLHTAGAGALCPSGCGCSVLRAARPSDGSKPEHFPDIAIHIRQGWNMSWSLPNCSTNLDRCRTGSEKG